MSTFSKTISNGDPLIVGGGNSIYIHNVPGADITVIVKKNGKAIHIAENVQEGWEYWGVPLPGNDRVFDSVEFSCSTSNLIKVETSKERTRINRTVGTVEVSNLNSVQSLNQDRYFAEYLYGGAASNYSHIQLLNPAASGKLLSVSRAKVSIGSTSSGIFFRQYDTALTSLLTNHFTNKYIGGAAPVAQYRVEQNAAVLGSPRLGSTHPPTTALYTDTEIIKHDPLIIPQGVGIVFTADAANVPISVRFEWQEIAV